MLVWTAEQVDILVEDRTTSNPVPFKTIATTLNRMFPTSLVRPVTTRDCLNKWINLFPTSADATSTVHYLHNLTQSWPGTSAKVEIARNGVDRRPTINAIHIVWPWAQKCVQTLAKNVFIDATFKVTCYKYRVVCMTTLDGNKQHRPLMVSFILSLKGDQWKRIFDFFAK